MTAPPLPNLAGPTPAGDEPLSQDELDGFFTAAACAFDEATGRLGRHRLALLIADVRIDVLFAGEALRDAMAPALAGCAIDAEDAARVDAARVDAAGADAAGGPGVVTLCVYDTAGSGVAMPPPPRDIMRFVTWRGDVWSDDAARTRLVFHQSDYTLQVFDPRRATGVFVVDRATLLPFWSLAAPLRSLLALALATRGVQLVHAAAVGTAAGAVLVTGYGGSGKSTTALTCLAAGLGFAGDDYVAVRPARGDGTPATVHSVFATAKVSFAELERLAPLRGFVRATEHTRQPKAVLLPFAADQRLLLRAAPLVGSFAARLGEGAGTTIAPVGAAEVAAIAFTSTALQIPYADEAARRRIEGAMVRPHELILGGDRAGVVRAIETFLADRTATAPARVRDAGARPPISVVVPVHNGAHFLAETLESIRAQRYPDIEIIVVDDGSTDDIARVSAGVAVPHRLIRQARGGPAAARNAGILAARGTLIAFLDIDDAWPDGNLVRLATALSLDPGLHVVHGKADIFVQDAGTGERRRVRHVRANFPFYLGAGLYRRVAFDTVGLLAAEMIYGEDSDWFLRAYDRVRVLMLPEVALLVRNHDANMTLNKTPAQLGALHVLKRHLDRRRAAAAGTGTA